MIIAIIYIFRIKKNCQNLGNYIKGFNEYNLFKQNKVDNENIELYKLLAK
jgi:hypothetical protein